MNSDNYPAIAESIVGKPYARKLIPDPSGGYTATIQEFPGCIAEGESADEALSNLSDAATAWVSSQLAMGQPIPEPLSNVRYSGKLALRIPRGLHKQAAELAAIDGASLNQFITTALSAYCAQKSLANSLHREAQKIVQAIHSLRNVAASLSNVRFSDFKDTNSSKRVMFVPNLIKNMDEKVFVGSNNLNILELDR